MQSPTPNLPLVTACLNNGAKLKIRDEYARRIANGSIYDLHAGFDPRYYPGEVLASVIAIAEDTGDAAMMAWAVGQLDVLGQRIEAHNGFLIWPDEIDGQPTFGELAQSRLVLSFALIYRATGNALAKRGALLAFAALERLPLVDVTSSQTGRVYRLPVYAYHDELDPAPISYRTLDPNHDAALAAAYTIMGKFVLDDQAAAAQALARGNEYLAAASDLAVADKCLALADDAGFRDVCDTRYNGFWSVLLEIVAHHGPSSDAARTVDLQFPFARSAILAFETHRFYPSVETGPYPDPVEPLLWLPSAVRRLPAADFQIFVQRINSFIENGDALRWPAGSLYPKYYE